MVALAAILDGQEEDEEAERLYLEALRRFEGLPRADINDVAVALNNLGALYVRKGLHDQATELLERAAALKKRTLGPRHPDVAVTLNNLATLCRRRRELGPAAALYAEAVGIFEQSLGADHLKAIACRANAARCRAEAAEAIL